MQLTPHHTPNEIVTPALSATIPRLQNNMKLAEYLLHFDFQRIFTRLPNPVYETHSKPIALRYNQLPSQKQGSEMKSTEFGSAAVAPYLQKGH
ncbi:unnamed protein product [Hermetia illucens]|uniref:Uncharacterized protein n=1 Tax=Hermetia illucens TaxID=343691 RepID=A0A7R8UMB5_HERIL|nr:unnamed protein product [Hermetia illucens]